MLGDPIELLAITPVMSRRVMFVDPVASLYGRNALKEIVKEVSKNVFIPVTVAGGVRSLTDVETLLEAGADRVGKHSCS